MAKLTSAAAFLPANPFRETPGIVQQGFPFLCGTGAPVEHHGDDEVELTLLVSEIGHARIDDPSVQNIA